MTESSIRVEPLLHEDAPTLSNLLSRQRKEYLRHFHPFDFSLDGVKAEISKASKDRYWALWNSSGLIGFFMLRGLDDGYSRPSFGVMIDEKHSRQGLAGKALAHSVDWCVQNGIQRVMLKVAEENIAAVRAYERAGFVTIGACKRTGQRMMEKELKPMTRLEQGGADAQDNVVTAAGM